MKLRILAVINGESSPVMVIAEPLRAELAPAGVHLSWRYQEGVCEGFHVYRRQQGRAWAERLTAQPIPGFSGEAEYTDEVPDVLRGAELRYAYGMIRDGIEITRSSEVPVTFGSATPGAFVLHPNCPNPFNPDTQIRFELPRAGHVRLLVFDLAGRKIRTLVDGHLAAAVHTQRWDGRDDRGLPAASGVYFVKLEVNGEVATEKLALLR